MLHTIAFKNLDGAIVHLDGDGYLKFSLRIGQGDIIIPLIPAFFRTILDNLEHILIRIICVRHEYPPFMVNRNVKCKILDYIKIIF